MGNSAFVLALALVFSGTLLVALFMYYHYSFL